MRTEGTSIVAALVLHAGLLLIARALPPLSLLVARDRKALDTIEIVELPPSKPVAEVREAPVVNDVPRAPEPDQRPQQPEAHVAPRVAPSPQAPTTAEPENPPPTAQRPPTQWDKHPDEQPGVLGVPGLGGPAAWAMPGVLPGPSGPPPPAPTVAPAARPVDKDIATKVLNEALAKNDNELGLNIPVAGSMATAVRGAVQSSDIPANTSGTIECRVSPSGSVSGCKLVGSTGGGAASWAGAVNAASGIAGAALTGHYAKGAVVTISISISNSPPAGSKGGLSGAGANFDLANVGAHATRVVRARASVAAAR